MASTSEPPDTLLLLHVLWVQVWATAASNVVSALLGLGGVAYLGFLIAIYRPAKLFCDAGTWGTASPTEEEIGNCLWRIRLLDVSRSR